MKIKDLKPLQRICFTGIPDETFTVYGEPFQREGGLWCVDTTCDGDYCWEFSENREDQLYLETSDEY